MFGGFALRANSFGHLEQIESYAPGHQVRFGSLNYTADIRGDLIFDGFEPLPSAPHCHDEHDLALPPNSALEAAPALASTLNSEPTAPVEDGWLDAASGAPPFCTQLPPQVQGGPHGGSVHSRAAPSGLQGHPNAGQAVSTGPAAVLPPPLASEEGLATTHGPSGPPRYHP